MDTSRATIAIAALALALAGCASAAAPAEDPDRAVIFTVPTSNQIIGLQTTIVVPPTPAAAGTLFLWPGLQPLTDGTNFEPIDNGVLQSVLTWGLSCAPTTQPAAYSSWWISPQYVNTFNPADSWYHGCHSGPSLTVSPGDVLTIDMALNDGEWTQTVTKSAGTGTDVGQAVSFVIDMQGQAQNIVYFKIEEVDAATFNGPLVFTHTTIALQHPAVDACTPASLSLHPSRDTASIPVPKAGGSQCVIESISVG